jgi:hypothetical protein
MTPDPYFDHEFNPYAAPKADVTGVGEAEHGAWRVGNDLIMTRDAVLPDRCMKCNEPAGGWVLRKKLTWHPQAYYLLVLINLFLYILVAVIVQKSAKVRFPLCEEHRRRRRWAIAIGWLLGLGGIPVMIAGAALSSSVQGQASDSIAIGGFVAGLVMIVVGLFVGFIGARVATTMKIDRNFVWLSKVDSRFLWSLPPYGG